MKKTDRIIIPSWQTYSCANFLYFSLSNHFVYASMSYIHPFYVTLSPLLNFVLSPEKTISGFLVSAIFILKLQ